ncbi:unnamed protein product [Protopolystoma xenopodis]|uniref:Uncharacterized protein n=1 Tax=Protopolystoma xenopodis TaxID=117903 RepID=A0A3S5APX2_9PLAT|nr:unnamed protein product [Protopolystoma xenopodis]
MLMVGSAWETDKEDEQVCGAVFQCRARGLKLAIWTSDCSDSETVMRIGARMRTRDCSDLATVMRIGARLMSVVQPSEPLFYQTLMQSIWTSDCLDSETVVRIGARMKSVVQYHEPLFYQTVDEQKSLSRGVHYLSVKFKIE